MATAYRQAPEHIRRMLNQVLFDKVYITPDDETGLLTAIVRYQPPFDGVLGVRGGPVGEREPGGALGEEQGSLGDVAGEAALRRDDDVASSRQCDFVVSTSEGPGLHGLPDDGLPAPKPSKNKQKPTSWGFHDVCLSVDSMVGVTRLELATSRPPAVRATSCATPRQHHYYSIPIVVSSKDVFVECKLNTILLRGRHRSYCKNIRI